MRNCLNLILIKSNITQYELAKTLGISRSVISRIISGKLTPSLSLAFSIARVLDCKVDDIFFPTESELRLAKNGNFNNQRNRKSA
ncbi:MAG: helix-turn-helix transcriptional regulator [Candidatus Aenigmarchaeota archaeon]|nr:helix-turn-helix transcriptional regulator [Candidatus Aenigmarchaeota archaeon]